MTNGDLFSPFSEAQLLQHILADLHDELPERLARFRYLADQSATLGASGTLIYGGTPAYSAFSEARSSFVQGNFMATVLLCQALAEHTLAALLNAVGFEKLPRKISFENTLSLCRRERMITEQDAVDLKRLSELRNPLTHFRDLSDPVHLDRRAISDNQTAMDLLAQDAHFAIAVMIRLLGKRAFKLDR
jgi:hypothetical protein